MSKKNELDQYYTSDTVAEQCAAILRSHVLVRQVVEPSAGGGAFLRAFSYKAPTMTIAGKQYPHVIALDLAPAADGIEQADFLEVDLSGRTPRRSCCAVVGNPPFGHASSLAVKFFNKAAEFAGVIAFIVPKTFRKESVQRKLNSNFHLLHDYELPENSFLLDGQPYDVPCCFQIWIHSDVERAPEEKIPQLFEKVSPQKAQVAVRRVGGRAGQVLGVKQLSQFSESSTYFLREVYPGALDTLLKGVDLSEVRDNTAGVRSVSMAELERAVWDAM